MRYYNVVALQKAEYNLNDYLTLINASIRLLTLLSSYIIYCVVIIGNNR